MLVLHRVLSKPKSSLPKLLGNKGDDKGEGGDKGGDKGVEEGDDTGADKGGAGRKDTPRQPPTT